MDNETLFQARTNPDFLKYLEESRINSIKSQDIGLMYETLDSMLVLIWMKKISINFMKRF